MNRDRWIYFKNCLKTLLRHPDPLTLIALVKYYPAWRKHLEPGRNSVDDNMPWISFAAIDFIKSIIRPDMMVFEYGSGGSSLFWSARVKKLISVEHDRPWFEKMQEALRQRGTENISLGLAEPEPDPDFQRKQKENPEDYISEDPQYKGKNFTKYVTSIDPFPDECFDVVVVDGRARPSCIQHAQAKVKAGGYLIVDNSERPYYLSSFHFNHASWKRRDFEGPVPYVRHFSQTTIFKKLAKTTDSK